MKVRVLWAHTSEVPRELLSRYRSWIQPEEWADLSKTRSPEALQDRILTRGLLRVALGSELELEPESVGFWKDPQGKLHLQAGVSANRDLDFSLSHTVGVAACVTFCGGRCGIDVERADRAVPPESVRNRFLTPKESVFLDSLAAGERPLAFLHLWTLKEAYLKAVGAGLGVSPEKIGFTPTEAEPGMSFFQLEAVPSWIGAVAADGSDRSLTVECLQTGNPPMEGHSVRVRGIPGE